MPRETTPALRASFRLSSDYVLRWAELVGELFEGDHLRALVLNTILRLNVSHLLEDPQLNLRYGGLQPPPDSERRPVTISQAARAMAMPRVTARRYVLRLVETDSLIDMGRAGYIVPGRELVHAQALAATDPTYQNMILLLRRLQAAGIVPAPPADGPLFGRDVRYRLVLRLLGVFLSDWMSAWNASHSPGYLYGLIFGAVVQANDRNGSLIDLPSDDAKTPISAHATALSLRLPPETVRRHVLRLESEGLLQRRETGLIAPESAFATAAGEAILRGAHEAVLKLAGEVTRYQVDLAS
ncbi:MAG: hypothetical protein Q7T61_02295 [Caulobacter sp.]|nr:hypothetical protein [Caulobacter sp.]